jgi:hypothetical protein
LVKGKTVGIAATTLEANAALRSIVHRETGETYQEFLKKVAQASDGYRRVGVIPSRRIRLGRGLQCSRRPLTAW